MISGERTGLSGALPGNHANGVKQMKIYNVDRRFFALKADAVTYCREIGKSVRCDVLTLVVKNRDDLAALLNGLCAIDRDEGQQGDAPQMWTPPRVAPIPDCVPQFLRKDWL